MASRLYPSLEEFYKNNNIEYGDEDIWYSVSDNKLYRTRKLAQNTAMGSTSKTTHVNDNSHSSHILPAPLHIAIPNSEELEAVHLKIEPTAPPLEEISWDELENLDFHPDYSWFTDQSLLPPPYSPHDPLCNNSNYNRENNKYNNSNASWVDDLQPDYDDDTADTFTSTLEEDTRPHISVHVQHKYNANVINKFVSPPQQLTHKNTAQLSNINGPSSRSRFKPMDDLIPILYIRKSPKTPENRYSKGRSGYGLTKNIDDRANKANPRSTGLQNISDKRNEKRLPQQKRFNLEPLANADFIAGSRSNSNAADKKTRGGGDSGGIVGGGGKVGKVGMRVKSGGIVNDVGNGDIPNQGDYNAWVKWRKQVNRQLAALILLRRGDEVRLQTVDLSRKPLSKNSMKEVFHKATNDCSKEAMTSLNGKPYIMYGIPRVALSKSSRAP